MPEAKAGAATTKTTPEQGEDDDQDGDQDDNPLKRLGHRDVCDNRPDKEAYDGDSQNKTKHENPSCNGLRTRHRPVCAAGYFLTA